MAYGSRYGLLDKLIHSLSDKLHSSEESVKTSTARVILFGTIPTAIPVTVPIVDPPVVHDDTPLILTETPTILHVVSTLPYTSPFMYTDSSDSDTSERPPSQDPYKVTVARYSESHSSSKHFSSDDFSSNTSLGSSSCYSSYTSLGHYIPDSSFDTPTASFAGPSHKRRRSHAVSVLLATPVPRALSSDDSVESSYEAYTERDIDSDVQADIDVDTAAAEAAAAREAYAKVKVETRIDKEDEVKEAESSHRGTVVIGVNTVVELVVLEDTPLPIDDRSSKETAQIGLDEIV
uniref:Uncharacterized protein n=1 Tax=Tanacetum cinerariifolium TaxID=118510 RepID=A0A6L2K0I7_TANCI|nr:hypothetical protein [Tanacetum cinerariifolium]